MEESKMNKIYRKNEVTFAIICIVIYVVGTSLCEALAQSMGIIKLPSMIFHLALTVLILFWMGKNGLYEKYGLIKPSYRIYRVWFYIPLILIGFSGIFFGVTLKYSAAETAFYIISMLCVGFLEEVIFRGFLFTGMAKRNVKSAVIVSSLTFGIGHIVNLLNGQDPAETALQIVFATAVGFMLVTLFYKGKSLMPCIIFHGINNACSAVSDEEASLGFFGSAEREMLFSLVFSLVICVIYSLALWKSLNAEKGTDTARL